MTVFDDLTLFLYLYCAGLSISTVFVCDLISVLYIHDQHLAYALEALLSIAPLCSHENKIIVK